MARDDIVRGVLGLLEGFLFQIGTKEYMKKMVPNGFR